MFRTILEGCEDRLDARAGLPFDDGEGADEEGQHADPLQNFRADSQKGNEHILDLLRVAKGHMHAGSRLYLPVHTLTDYHETMRQAVANYNAKLVAVGSLPTKEFVAENIDFYLKLNETGLIRIFRQDGGWRSNGYVFELSL